MELHAAVDPEALISVIKHHGPRDFQVQVRSVIYAARFIKHGVIVADQTHNRQAVFFPDEVAQVQNLTAQMFLLKARRPNDTAGGHLHGADVLEGGRGRLTSVHGKANGARSGEGGDNLFVGAEQAVSSDQGRTYPRKEDAACVSGAGGRVFKIAEAFFSVSAVAAARGDIAKQAEVAEQAVFSAEIKLVLPGVQRKGQFLRQEHDFSRGDLPFRQPAEHSVLLFIRQGVVAEIQGPARGVHDFDPVRFLRGHRLADQQVAGAHARGLLHGGVALFGVFVPRSGKWPRHERPCLITPQAAVLLRCGCREAVHALSVGTPEADLLPGGGNGETAVHAPPADKVFSVTENHTVFSRPQRHHRKLPAVMAAADGPALKSPGPPAAVPKFEPVREEAFFIGDGRLV